MGQGHEHADLREHGCWPARRRIHALVLAAQQEAVGRVPVALQRLAAGAACPEEVACLRILRHLEAAGLPRATVMMGGREEAALTPLVSRRARLARGQSWRQGLQVATSSGGGCEAVLVWPCEAAVVRPQTLEALLQAGPAELVRRAPLWVRSPAVDHEDRGLGQPWLLSMGAAQAALAQRRASTLKEALEAAGVFWQRVLVQDRLVLVRMGGAAQSWPWLSAAGREEL